MNVQLTLALRYLRGRRLRTVLTTLAIIFGVMILFGMNIMLPTMLNTFRQNMLASASKVDLTITHMTGGVFAQDTLDTIRDTPDIAQFSPSLRQTVQLPGAPAATQPLAGKPGASTINAVTLAGIDPETAQAIRAYPLLSGRFLEPGDGDVIVLPETVASKLNLTLGDVFTLPSTAGTTRFTVVGLLVAIPTLGVEEVYVPLAAAQAALNHPGRINTIEAIYQAGADPVRVEQTIRGRLGEDYKLGPLEIGAELLASLELGKAALNVFGAMALAMAAFVIFNTFRTIVAERRRDLGMLRAVGASRGTVVGLILVESLIQGLLGSLLGILSGLAFAVLTMALMEPMIRQFLHMELTGLALSLDNVLFALILGVGTTVLGGLIPALSVMQITPLEALRPVIEARQQRAASGRAILGAAVLIAAALGLLSQIPALTLLSAFLFLISLVLIAPILIKPIADTFGQLLNLAFAREGRLAQGNLTRQPGRAAITASAMMIGLAIVIALAGLVSSMITGFTGYIDHSLGSDFLLMPPSLILSGNVGSAPDLAKEVRALPGIGEITTLRMGKARIVDGAEFQVIGIDPQTYPVLSGLEFSEGDPQTAYRALDEGRAVVVNGIFAMQNRLEVGQALDIQTAEGRQTYRIVGIGLDYLNAKLATAYISQANLERDFHQTNDVLIMANLADGADADTVRRALLKLTETYPVYTLLDSLSFKASQVNTLRGIMSGIYALMIMLAIPGLIAMINTLAISVIERTREIGLLRAVGSTRQQIWRMILAESLLLAGTGIAFGIAAGLWLGYVLTGALNMSGFIMPYSFPLNGLLGSIGVGLFFGVLAALIPARQAARLEIVSALRYE